MNKNRKAGLSAGLSAGAFVLFGGLLIFAASFLVGWP